MTKTPSLLSRRLSLLLAVVFSCQVVIADNQRSADDLARDRHSKPSAVANFVAVEPGWRVLDLFAGDGYYSEVFARAVGANGEVVLHNSRATKVSLSRLQHRLGRISYKTGKSPLWPNIRVVEADLADLTLAANQFDLVLLAKVYHDAYYQANGWQLQAEPLFNLIHRLLKPQGILAVIDHHAAPESGASHAQTLHRIEDQFAIQDISQRGFTLLAQSDLLFNAHDDLQRSVFHPSVRGRTSRFLLTFRKKATKKRGP